MAITVEKSLFSGWQVVAEDDETELRTESERGKANGKCSAIVGILRDSVGTGREFEGDRLLDEPISCASRDVRSSVI